MTDTTTPSERIDPGAEQAHRYDLARDVARIWAAIPAGDAVTVDDALVAALDRLAAAYGDTH